MRKDNYSAFPWEKNLAVLNNFDIFITWKCLWVLGSSDKIQTNLGPNIYCKLLKIQLISSLWQWHNWCLKDGIDPHLEHLIPPNTNGTIFVVVNLHVYSEIQNTSPNSLCFLFTLPFLILPPGLHKEGGGN